MKKRLLRIFLNWTTVLILIVLIAVVVSAAILDGHAFYVNVSAGILDIFLGFIFAVIFL